MEQKIYETAANLVAQMTLEEKASLCSGMDFWHTKGVERLGLSGVMVTDGPHGLRKQAASADHLGLNQSVPATCFPTASATACSFDRGLMKELGTALGEECVQEDVAVLLGPGANIKRSPLCGRNFEYISEDPCLTGETAAAIISGIQSKNVGVSLKHFALNNQERARMSGDSVVDERAMRELYLTGFETAVKKAAPWTLMCSYNKINGTYAADDQRLLNYILRDEWGFEGAVMTDWGAVHDRIRGVEAGLDLEMPASGGVTDAQLVAAVRSGVLEEALLDRCAAHVAAIALAHRANTPAPYDADAHHALARRAARESAVLLKNGGLLPVNKTAKVAVIGQFAKHPRYQGAGSSRINPTRMTTVLDAFDEAGIRYTYAEGYPMDSDEPDEARIAAAVETARAADVVFVLVGLPDRYEGEGHDRTHLDLPAAHNALVETLTDAHPHVAAVLFGGSAMALPWRGRVESILLMHLPGQAHGGAVYDLLFGDASPGGKLAETWPLRLEDTPAYAHFGKAGPVEYRESIYVGYRYYDKAGREVAYPFGHGLSYTEFTYRDLKLDRQHLSEQDTLAVALTVENTGPCAGAEVIQLYVAPPETTLFKPVRELRGYTKVFLAPGERRTVSFTLASRAFSYYNTAQSRWAVEDGDYRVELGASSRDIRASAPVRMAAEEKVSVPDQRALTAYFIPDNSDFPVGQFETLLGRPLPKPPAVQPFTADSTIAELRMAPAGAALVEKLLTGMAGQFGEEGDMSHMMSAMLEDIPLRALVLFADGALTRTQLDSFIAGVNAGE